MKKRRIKDKLKYLLSYEYSAKGKKEFAFGFLLGLLADVFAALAIIAAAIILVYFLLVIKMRAGI